MNINDRLRLIREDKGLSQAKFAKKFNLAQSTYAQYELDKRALPDNLKESLATEFNINIHWLVTGIGSMYLGKGANLSKQEIDDKINSQLLNFKQTVVEQGKRIMNSKGVSALLDGNYTNTAPLRILSQSVSAGHGDHWNDDNDIIDIIQIPEYFIRGHKLDKVFGLKVRGNSMEDVKISHGDVVIFAQGEMADSGIHVISIDGDLYVKSLEYNPIKRIVKVISKNQNYEPMVISIDDDRMSILGKVISWIHSDF